MISAIVAVTVFGLVFSLIVLFARDGGPAPADIAVSYELAWDRLDFDTLWTLSGDELRDGLDKRAYTTAKSAASGAERVRGRPLSGWVRRISRHASSRRWQPNSS